VFELEEFSVLAVYSRLAELLDPGNQLEMFSHENKAGGGVTVHGVRTLRVPRALSWRSSLSPCALFRHVYIRDTSCKQTTLIALHKAITTVDRTIHISLCMILETSWKCSPTRTRQEEEGRSARRPRNGFVACFGCEWVGWGQRRFPRRGALRVC
jgi:hypothetical protein